MSVPSQQKSWWSHSLTWHEGQEVRHLKQHLAADVQTSAGPVTRNPKDPNPIGLPETGSRLLRIIRILDPNPTGGAGLKTQQVSEDTLGIRIRQVAQASIRHRTCQLQPELPADWLTTATWTALVETLRLCGHKLGPCYPIGGLLCD